MILLRDGVTETSQARLDRIVHLDERSRDYPVMAVAEVADKSKPRPQTWTLSRCLNQGVEGACVGFAWAHEMNADPVQVAVNSNQARGIYWEAQKRDPWPGGEYPGATPKMSGSGVLFGAKVLKELGYLPEYRWAFSVRELEMAISWVGPAVLGIPWMEGMMTPASNGVISASGKQVGGHAICCIGVDPSTKQFILHNSWGRSWGKSGRARISYDDLQKVLRHHGEACIPMRRSVGQPLPSA